MFFGQFAESSTGEPKTDENEKSRLVEDLAKYPIRSACIQLIDGGLVVIEIETTKHKQGKFL